MKGKSRKKSQKGKKRDAARILLFLIPVGIGLAMLYLFHEDIFRFLQPGVEKPGHGTVVPKREVLLFFSDPDSEYLIGEKRKILRKNGAEEEAGETIMELIKGPKGKLIPTVPPHTRLLAFHLDETGMAKVNFDRSFSKDHPGGSSAEMMTAYSIVNSLALNFPQIKRVQILVEGKAIETISGHLSLKQPISPKPDLIKKTGN